MRRILDKKMLLMGTSSQLYITFCAYMMLRKDKTELPIYHG